jgi:hypothetical protein
MKKFTVAFDPEYGTWLVLSTETRARSFAMVPVGVAWEFTNRGDAQAQARALSGTETPVRMIETPERFEAVADTAYGVAW